ncbi:MAG: DUF2946 family protein [Novosphingobium sp.]|uniref:DUF2946 family protein n=1 Tax=Novosphingobium sp. TaxID=1874826 RepID=UPI003B990772
MRLLRAMILRHRALAALAVLAALCMKAVVPSGYMIEQGSHILTIRMCDEAGGGHTVKQIAIPMKSGGSEAGSKQVKGDCPFASHAMAGLGGADPALLALAIAFILALGFAPATIPLPRRVAHLRPPLRGPPALG